MSECSGTCERSAQCGVSEQMSSARKRVSVRVNKRTDERVAQYLHLDFLLFWPTVLFKVHQKDRFDHESTFSAQKKRENIVGWASN